MPKFAKIGAVGIFFFALALHAQGLCTQLNSKPEIYSGPITHAQLVDALTEIAGLKQKAQWPKDTSKMTAAEYYQLEVKTLVSNGFPSIFNEVSPDALVSRRFFNSLMFQIAVENDATFRKDCKDAQTEDARVECLRNHANIFVKSEKASGDEMLAVLCLKKAMIAKKSSGIRVSFEPIEEMETNPQEYSEEGAVYFATDLCSFPDLNYVMAQVPMTQAELADALVSIRNLKSKPDWPKDTSKLDKNDYYQLEAKSLAKNGLTPIFLEVAPDTMVTRRFFNSLMFDFAEKGDKKFQTECKKSQTEAEMADCLLDHNYIFSKDRGIYRDEIISVLCQKKDVYISKGK